METQIPKLFDSTVPQKDMSNYNFASKFIKDGKIYSKC